MSCLPNIKFIKYINTLNLDVSNNLNLKTKTLTYSNSTDSSYSSNNSFNVGTNIGFSKEVKDPQPTDDSITKINSTNLAFSNSLGYQRNKTLATLGKGNIDIQDSQNSDDITSLNRDTKNISKTMVNTSYGVKVDATLDHRLLTEEGRNQIKQEYEEMNKNMNIIAGTLPDANSDNLVEAVAGEVWNKLTKYLSLGLIPSNENNGGVLAQIPILTGMEDSKHMVLQVVNQHSGKYNASDYIKMEESSYFKSLSLEDKAFYEGKGLYVSKIPVEVNPSTATYQNSINGIMTNIGEAIKNGLQQTGQLDVSKPVELTVGYNPSYGFLPDLLESFVDKSGIGTTGIAKQTGQFVNEVTTARGDIGSNFAMHSQANAIVYNGIAYVQTTTGFQPVGYYKTGEINSDGSPKINVPTFVSFGSPMNRDSMKDLIAKPIEEGGKLGYKYSGAYTKPNDFVGEVLGGNSGNNEQATLLQQANIINAYKLFTSDSPHSTYICQDYANEGVQCGYRQ